MKKGISLIVLVITIVVIIILAAAVILSLGENNPINNSRAAQISQDKDSIESAILVYIGSIQARTLASNITEEIIRGSVLDTASYGIVGSDTLTNKDGETLYNIDKTKYDEKINTLPEVTDASWYVDSKGNVYLVYEETTNIPSWVKESDTLNSFVLSKDNKEFSAKAVAKNPTLYYGATVTNYSANGVSDFKVFHSDGENIYLITSDYIDLDKIPLTRSGNKLGNADTSYPKAAMLLGAIIDDAYATGSAAIDASNPARKWLASYLDNYSSTADNMKGVAYLMDTSVWNIYKNDIADYVIGGPTIDMLFASYNNKYKTNYQARATSATGYKISTDGGKNWIEYGFKIIDASDALYCVKMTDGVEDSEMWIASPGNYKETALYALAENGTVSQAVFSDFRLGFRPIVCLKANISVVLNEDGSVTLD